MRGRSTRIAVVAVGALAGSVGIAASARAAASCSVEALNALHVPDVSVTDAKPMAAAGTAPAYCDVHGTVVTKGEGVADGLARFAMQLPKAWQQRFLFLGVGGNAGNLVPSANATDQSLALGKGYATILTDTGHVGDGVSARWTRLPDGRPDTVKRTDFFYRAAHDVTVAGKALARGLLCREGGARLFRRLLDRRTHGNDGGRSLPRGLRRCDRWRSVAE